MSLQHLTSGLKVVVGQYSSPGVKPVNEDAIGIRIPEGPTLTSKGIVAVIADGVSAAEEGREASNTAVLSFLSDYYSTHDTWSVERSASKVITALNQWLYGLSCKYIRAEKGYVTTFSAAVFKSASAYLFHVGDSRIYRIRGGAIEQITRDHTANVGKDQSYLTRALGIDVNLDVDFHHLDTRPGDLFIFTTDGVHGWLKNADFMDILGPCAQDMEVGSLDPLCRKLVELALERGSDDNLSAQLVRIQNADELAQQDLLAAVSNLPFPPPLKPGQKIDDWLVLREIHASTRSEVYLVEHQATGKKAVLKAPSALLSDDPAYIERFILEEWVGSRIASSHVVKVVRPDQHKSFLYYLTEYVEGPTLGRLLKERTRLSVVDTQNIIIQAVSGLRAFHRRDVLHQDIKPDNIIYTEQEGIKIIDFGSCQSAGISQINTRINLESKLGTRDYCAPEYLLGTPVSPLSDQFSLAVLCYELLTGKHPFGPSYQRCESAQDFARLKYIPAHTVNPLVPVWLDAAMQKALNIDPAKRYPALSEFAQDIKTPNSQLKLQRQSGGGLRESLFFWKAFVVGLLLTNLVTLVLLASAVG